LIGSGPWPSGWTGPEARAFGPSCASSNRLLQEQLLPHEQREETDVYPLVARLLGGRDPMAALSRTHHEILHLVNVYRRLIADLPAPGTDPAVWSELRRVLFSLEAILRLYIDQEDEIYDIVGQAG
jgi:hypothetical protein